MKKAFSVTIDSEEGCHERQCHYVPVEVCGHIGLFFVILCITTTKLRKIIGKLMENSIILHVK